MQKLLLSSFEFILVYLCLSCPCSLCWGLRRLVFFITWLHLLNFPHDKLLATLIMRFVVLELHVEDLEDKGVFEGDFFDEIVAPGSAGMSGVEIGFEQQ